MSDLSTLKPFHESIVGAINAAASAAELSTLGHLITTTKIPKGHDDIVETWNLRAGNLGLNDADGVADSVMAQKQPEPAIA